MNYIWDFAALLIIFVCMISCYHRGFLNSVVKTVGSIASLVVSAIFSLPIAKSIYDNAVKNKVVALLEEKMQSMSTVELQQFETAVKEGLTELPGKVGEFITPNFEEYLNKWFENFSSINFDGFSDAFATSVVEPVLVVCIRAVVFLIMFAVLSFIVNLVASLFKGVRFIPIIGSLNAVLGAALGVFQGIIYILILCGIIWVIITFFGGIDGVITPQIIKNTFILNKFFSLVPWFGGIFAQYNFI